MFQVLVASSHEVFDWVDKKSVKSVPSDIVTRDCSPEGQHVYIIRAVYRGKYAVGYYAEGNEYAVFEHHGVKYSDDWEYLVSSEHVTGMYTSTLLC